MPVTSAPLFSEARRRVPTGRPVFRRGKGDYPRVAGGGKSLHKFRELLAEDPPADVRIIRVGLGLCQASGLEGCDAGLSQLNS